ncbi:hypothetical protein V1477_020852 [Vespula maculifrons]|uniref:Uncharacterized protein n=1 Tax=Vespula maculifrons TaxID=7453 RepID=A0ABD2ANZ7_VESMC
MDPTKKKFSEREKEEEGNCKRSETGESTCSAGREHSSLTHRFRETRRSFAFHGRVSCQHEQQMTVG